MKKISIIIATYNSEATLGKCLDSIVVQKGPDIELIIIDGNSQDATAAILQKYSPEIDHVLSEPDTGVYDAWNKGIALSTGQWVMFVGSDDILLPNSISKCLALVSDHKYDSYDYVCGKNRYVSLDDVYLQDIGAEPIWNLFKKRMVAAHVASLHNKHNLFDKVGGYDLQYKICADYELLLRKGKELKYFYWTESIAQMAIGGMSFTYKAIFETFKIRKNRKTVPLFVNVICLVYDLLCFATYNFRKTNK